MGAQNNIAGRRRVATGLEVPRPSEMRGATSEASLIGRRLVRVFDVHDGVPREMGVLLHTLAEKTAR